MGSSVSTKQQHGRVQEATASAGSLGGKGHSTTTALQYVRQAYHAGSWYQDDPDDLRNTLERFFENAETETTASTTASTSRSSSSCSNGGDTERQDGDDDACGQTKNATTTYVRGMIVPHAGYSYSGPTAAYAYLALRNELLLSSSSSPIRRILILHPSHHVYLDGCAISNASKIQTPVGDLDIDDELRDEILALPEGRNKFTLMDATTDEQEHSGEMQYPFLAHIIHNSCGSSSKNHNIRVLPIMCGALSNSSEQMYGQILSDIIARPDVCTVVSSDFCHWGSRFSFRPTPAAAAAAAASHSFWKSSSNNSSSSNTNIPLHEFIRQLDQRGMDHIEMQQPGAFAEYLKETRNTICGRHAIAVWLHAITSTTPNTSTTSPSSSSSSSELQVKFVKYAQSSQLVSASSRDSSVSYAAAIATSTTTTSTK